MKNICIFLLFLLYTISIFFVENYIVLGSVALLNIVLMVLTKMHFSKVIQNLLKIGIVVLLAFVFNFIMAGLNWAILTSVRLLLVCNMTYIILKIVPLNGLATVIERLCFPLKIFKINTKDIGLIVSIGIAFIPILKEELMQTRFALKAKGVNFNIRNILFYLKPTLVQVFKRVNEIEFALKAKGYVA